MRMKILYDRCVFCKDLESDKNGKSICNKKECKNYQKMVNYVPFWETMEDIGLVVRK